MTSKTYYKFLNEVIKSKFFKNIHKINTINIFNVTQCLKFNMFVTIISR